MSMRGISKRFMWDLSIRFCLIFLHEMFSLNELESMLKTSHYACNVTVQSCAEFFLQMCCFDALVQPRSALQQHQNRQSDMKYQYCQREPPGYFPIFLLYGKQDRVDRSDI